MKKLILKTKRIVNIALFTFIVQSTFACGTGGKIYIDTSICKSQGMAKLKLTNHITTIGTIYTWQQSNDNGLSWTTMVTNSGKDTQNINPFTLNRMYRCVSTCTSSSAFSDTVEVFFNQRQIDVIGKKCRVSINGNDSLSLKINLSNTSGKPDTAYSKFFKWQSSSTFGSFWNDISTNSSQINVKFTPNIIQYRAFISLCPLTFPNSALPSSSPVLINAINIGLNGMEISLIQKDCVMDSAKLGLKNVVSSLKNYFNYKWTDSCLSGSSYNININNSTLTTKVDKEWRIYTSIIKLCSNFNTSDFIKLDYNMNPVFHNFKDSLDCLNEKVVLDYTNRDSIRKDFYTYWARSQNNSSNFLGFNTPLVSEPYNFSLTNKTNNFYKVYSKFCSSSTSVLDSTPIVNVKLLIDTGQLKVNFGTCPNDSVYLELLNFTAVSSFPLIKKWMYKPFIEPTFIDYDLGPKTDTSLNIRMPMGWTFYLKSTAVCPDKYATKWTSSIAKTHLPYTLIDTITCSGNMKVRVIEDTIKSIDYSGTYFRNNISNTYQWLKSTNNKITSSIISGANSSSLNITQADKYSFFKRITKFCSSASNQDTTNWSNLVFNNPNALNGKAEIFDQICLNDSVRICVVNYTPMIGNTASYIWQVSNNEIEWTNLLTNSSNDSCIKVMVGSDYKYYRRLTYWCPSGIIDSTASTPLIYVQNLPWCEGFTNQSIFNKDVLFNCWRQSNPVCNSYFPIYSGGQVWSRSNTGKTSSGISNWGPNNVDAKNQNTKRRLDLKLITPAFKLIKGKIYRFSFWNREDTSNISWDSLYVTWGNSSNACAINNKIGNSLTNFSFDQYNKYWADFIPQYDGIYYFGINVREKDFTIGQIDFDNICLKELESCKGKSPVNGQTIAPNKLNHRSDAPSQTLGYNKDQVQHQYCIHDTIMLTYNENNFVSNFDYYGMTYKFYKKIEDVDWNATDTFFKEDTLYYLKIAGKDTLLSYSRFNSHIFNNNNHHVKNIVVTDTNTWYKIVATCQFDNKEYHSDSLLIQGTHSVPYCEDWEIGDIRNNTPPISNLPLGNSIQIVGKVPTFYGCPTCWGSFPQDPNPRPVAQDITFHSVSLPFRNPPSGAPLIPQLDPNQGWKGNNVVINCDNRAPGLTREVLVMPAVRLYKGRGYRVSFRWADNRRSEQSPWGNINQDLDNIYLMAVKGNQSGKTIDSFNISKMIPGSLKKDIQSNIAETGVGKYQTYWVDYTPSDTGTYYFGVSIEVGASNSGAYRFIMDYFCIDTLHMDAGCNDTPKFKNPLRLRVSPGGDIWSPGDTAFMGLHSQWCSGTKINLELDFGFGSDISWSYGWKMIWQRNLNQFVPNWTTVSTFIPGLTNNNGISFDLTYQYQDYRLIIANSCNTLFDTIGPFKIGTKGNFPYYENFETTPGILPQCWSVTNICNKVTVQSEIPNDNFFKAKSHTEYLNMDFENSTNSCPLATSATIIPPGLGLVAGVTYHFSFWYKDNGISNPIDSIKMAWSGIRATDNAPNTLINRVNNDIVRNSKTNKWRYYIADFTPIRDTNIHLKITSFNLNNKRIYRTMFDDFAFKFKKNIDALVIAIDSPDYNCALTSNSTIKVSVMNIGFNSISNLPVKLKVNGGSSISAIVPGITGPNQIRTIYIPNIDLSSPNINKVKAWTEAVGEEDPKDDTFATEIINNEMYPEPIDTIDSVCVCSNYLYPGISPNNMTRWYRAINDYSPFYIGDKIQMDSLCKDTFLFRSNWNGGVCYTSPQSSSFGTIQYNNAPGGLSFENLSLDTLFIDSVMIYANTLSSTSFNITLTQFQGVNMIPIGTSATHNPPLFIYKLGKQWLPVKIMVPPGTDYTLRYPGGASLALIPGYIFMANSSGCQSMNLNIVGDDTYPNISPNTFYKYFFNWKIEKKGCESGRTKISLKTVSKPDFKLKDTNRVCSQPAYQICGPTAPMGNKYTYQWNTSTLDTLICVGAKISQWYKLSVINEYGCKATDSFSLIVDPSPNFNLGPDTSFCKFSSYTINTKLNPINNTVTWSDNQTGVSINILNPGSYIATAFNTLNFCTARDTINIIRHELPDFSLGNDRVFCGSTANLQTQATNLPPLTYSWGTTGGPVISIPGVKKYWLDGIDSFGCINTDTIIANLISNPSFDLGADTVHCGSSLTIKGPIGDYYYFWNTTSTSKDLLVSTPGTYYLTVTDSVFGCSTEDSINVSFKQVPVFDLGADIVKCGLDHLITGPSGLGLNYSWQKPKRINIGSNNLYTADESGVYYLIVNNNCYTYTDSVKITLKTPAQNAIDILKDTFGCRQVSLRASSKNEFTKIQWGAPLTDTANIILVNKSGAYSVALTNECGTATKSVSIRIDTPPVANFEVKEYPDCMSVSLSNLSKNGIKYVWQFGDNKTSSIEHPLHTYTSDGDYLVSLNTYNSCGLSTKTLPIARRKSGCSSNIQATTLAESQVYIYPNPAKGSTQLIGIGLPNGKYTVKIQNLISQTIYEKSVHVFNNEIDEKLELMKYANGEYLVQISNDIETIVRKLHLIK